MIRLALAQINATVGDLSGNAKIIRENINKAKESHVDIVAFPELAITGYPPEDLLLKDHFIKNVRESVEAIALEVKDICVILGFVDKDKEGHIYNAAAVISKGRIEDVYRKHELPNYGVFDEKRYFTSGDSNNLYKIGYDYFAVNVCEDIWPDGKLCDQQAKKGAGLIINISSSPFDISKYKQREQLVKSRAKESNSFFAYVNMVGGQDELVFDGGSLIVDPEGEILNRADFFEEGMIFADLNLGKIREMKYKSFDIVDVVGKKKKTIETKIQNHKAKKLNETESIYKALVLGAKDYIQKNRFQKVLIGLSGGIDSAVVAAVAVEAIGADNVIGVTMPSRFTSDGTLTDAHKLASNLGIDIREVPIEGAFKKYLSMLESEFEGRPTDVAEENLQARIRGNILMALSNKFGWLVLTTGNKSELAVGYCTLYGDMSGGFAVIKDVPKTKVYELADFINSDEERIPKTTITRPPSAELRDNQKDQDSLPDYAVLDGILKDYVEDHKSIKTMVKSYPKDVVEKVVRLVDLNEYKRRQSPPGVKITTRAFGRDWRLPITNKYREA